jgi:hypothetical protein
MLPENRDPEFDELKRQRRDGKPYKARNTKKLASPEKGRPAAWPYQ